MHKELTNFRSKYAGKILPQKIWLLIEILNYSSSHQNKNTFTQMMFQNQPYIKESKKEQLDHTKCRQAAFDR